MPKSIYSRRHEKLRRELIEKRKTAGLTQEEVARRLGKHQSYVSKYETGERRLDVVEFMAVAEALGFPPGEVFQFLSKG